MHVDDALDFGSQMCLKGLLVIVEGGFAIDLYEIDKGKAQKGT